jgi:integrase/recombinase XerD
MLKRKGVSTEFIKENLGHSSVVTTEAYLCDFTDEVKIEISELLIPTKAK